MSSTPSNARLGAIARELHEALRELGAATPLQEVLRDIPDTRSRLTYVGQMTEKAAHRVLGLVEEALPKVESHAAGAQMLLEQLQATTAAHEVRVGAFAGDTLAFAAGQKQILTDIMLAQDFQDLSGQVIKRVIDVITRTESQLLQLLVDESDAGRGLQQVPTASEALLGPQVPGEALQQDDVDDLLASLGF